MSLINQMLKDLEHSKRQNEKQPYILRKLRSVSEPTQSLLRHPAWLLVLALLVVVGLFLFVPKRHADEKVVQAHAEKLTAAIHKVKPKLPVLPVTEDAIKPKHTKSLQAAQQQVLQTDKSIVQTVSQQKQPVKQSVPMDAQQQVDQLYQNAQKALDISDDDTAINSLEQLLRLKPEHIRARELLATVLLSDNQLDKADKVVDIGLHRLPHYAPFTNLKARILMNRGDMAKAINELSQAQPELDQSPDYYALLAALYQQSDKFIMAAQLYHQLVKYDPANAVWWMGLGIALESAEKNNAALEAFQHSLKAVGLSATAKAYVEQQISKLS